MHFKAHRVLAALTAAGSVLAIAGASTATPRPRPVEGPAATLTFRGSETRSWTMFERLFIVDGAQCERHFSAWHQVGDVNTIGGKHELELQIAAGKPIYLLTESYAGSQVCANLTSFTPQESGRYTVVEDRVTEHCVTTLTDDATAAPPPDAERLDVPKSCRLP